MKPGKKHNKTKQQTSNKKKLVRLTSRDAGAPESHQVRGRSFIRSQGGRGFWRGGGYNFQRGLILGGQFWNAQNVRGVEILRKRNSLLCKSCQTVLWLKQIHVSFKSRPKICFGVSLSATKCYPYKAWPRNLSAISTTRNVACMYAHTLMYTAEIWKKYIVFFIFPETSFKSHF